MSQANRIPLDRDWMERELNSGRTLTSIAEEVGCSLSLVSKRARQFGLTRYGLPAEQVAQIKQLLRNGSSVKEVADELGLTRPVAERVVTALDLTVHDLPIDQTQVEALFAEGLSYRQAASHLDLKESTLYAWCRRRGIRTNNITHALPEDEILSYARDGMSVAAIAAAVGTTPKRIRNLLRRHGVQWVAVRGKTVGPRSCLFCGETDPSQFADRTSGQNANRCRRCHTRVEKHRNAMARLRIIGYLGGECVACGYDKCMTALHVHHTDPSVKDRDWTSARRRWDEEFQTELDTCVLLCANCHAEQHCGDSCLDALVPPVPARAAVFTLDDAERLLAEYEALPKNGARSTFLIERGLDYSHISAWRRRVAA